MLASLLANPDSGYGTWRGAAIEIAGLPPLERMRMFLQRAEYGSSGHEQRTCARSVRMSGVFNTKGVTVKRVSQRADFEPGGAHSLSW